MSVIGSKKNLNPHKKNIPQGKNKETSGILNLMSGDQNSHIGQLSPNAITTVFTTETTGELLPAQYTTHLAPIYPSHISPLSLYLSAM
jgi:hypothetical protein